MPKKMLKRWYPDPEKIRKQPSLRFLGALVRDPYLFHLNRHSVSVACFVGLFIAFLPTPVGQIPLAALAALVFRCNLPLSLTLIWVSNPLTFPLILIAAYKLGAHLMQIPPEPFVMEASWVWLKTRFLDIWQPVLIGCVIMGMFAGCTGYILVQMAWRWHVSKKWKQRLSQRKERATLK